MSAPPFNETQKAALSALGVETVYLFGSRALGKEGPLSDYDYGVLLKEGGHRRGDDLYFALYDILASVSPRTLKNDVIDIVFLRDAGLELRFHVVRYGIVIHDHQPLARLRFEQATTLLYCDFRPLLDMFDRTLLASL